MTPFNVFRDGSTWRYSINGVLSPERFDSRDEAQLEAEKSVIALRKEEADKARAEKAKAKETSKED